MSDLQPAALAQVGSHIYTPSLSPPPPPPPHTHTLFQQPTITKQYPPVCSVRSSASRPCPGRQPYIHPLALPPPPPPPHTLCFNSLRLQNNTHLCVVSDLQPAALAQVGVRLTSEDVHLDLVVPPANGRLPRPVASGHVLTHADPQTCRVNNRVNNSGLEEHVLTPRPAGSTTGSTIPV